MRAASAFTSMSQLSALYFVNDDFVDVEGWSVLAKLPSLQRLELTVSTGDPSQLSALTGLRNLRVHSSKGSEANGQVICSFSSLQPLSTLLRLEVLQLGGWACAATSLYGLAGLSNLKLLKLGGAVELVNLDGISPWVVDLSISSATDLVSFADIQCCQSLEKLSLYEYGVISLGPLTGLGSMKQLEVTMCSLTSLEGFGSMSLQSLSLSMCSSLTHLSGLQHLSALNSLEVDYCHGLTSLQALSQLGTGLRTLTISGCRGVQGAVLELPHVQPTADVVVEYNNVKEVVLAGRVKRAVGPIRPHWA
jgi:hypothetical protein